MRVPGCPNKGVVVPWPVRLFCLYRSGQGSDGTTRWARLGNLLLSITLLERTEAFEREPQTIIVKRLLELIMEGQDHGA